MRRAWWPTTRSSASRSRTRQARGSGRSASAGRSTCATTTKATKERMDEPKVIETAADLAFDPHNANLGTDRGQELLRESIETCGVGRGIVADKAGVVFAGNKTLKAVREKGIPV